MSKISLHDLHRGTVLKDVPERIALYRLKYHPERYERIDGEPLEGVVEGQEIPVDPVEEVKQEVSESVAEAIAEADPEKPKKRRGRPRKKVEEDK